MRGCGNRLQTDFLKRNLFCLLPVIFGFVQKFYDRTLINLVCFALDSYPIHAVLHNFSKALRERLIQTVHGFVVFILAENVSRKI